MARAGKKNLKDFDAALRRAAEELKKLDRQTAVKLVSNLDADGITSASIIIRALEREGFKYSLMILHQLSDENAKAISEEDFGCFIFCDLGSGQLSSLNRHFKEKKVFILDHHEIQGKPEKNIVHVNPHDFGFDGSSEISAAGVCFLFARAMNKSNEDLAHLAIIGAIGDVQEKGGFADLNNRILEIAMKKGLVRVEKGLRLFGLETRPLNNLLRYSFDILIPGVTDDEYGTRRFLEEIDVPLSDRHGKWRTYYELSEHEIKRLTEGIIARRSAAGIKTPEAIFTNVYIIEGEEKGHFRDAKEFSTLLNSCGRLDNAALGIGACLGDQKQRKAAVKSLADYKRKIITSMEWYRKNDEKRSDRVIRGHNYIIINARDEIMATMIGTLASMISKNRELEHSIFVLSMARNPDKTTKVSLRVSGSPENIDLKQVISDLVKIVGGEAGGHRSAAGATIENEKEELFIEAAKEYFESLVR